MSPDTPTQSNDLPSALERVGKIMAVIASFSLIVSVFYDWGFISALGLRFSEIPTSVSDHVRSWLVWLPKVVIGVIGVLVFELLNRRIEKGMTEEEIVDKWFTDLCKNIGQQMDEESKFVADADLLPKKRRKVDKKV